MAGLNIRVHGPSIILYNSVIYISTYIHPNIYILCHIIHATIIIADVLFMYIADLQILIKLKFIIKPVDVQVKFISRFTKSKSDTHKIVVKTYNNDLIFCLFTEFRRSHSHRTGYLSLTTVLLQVVLFRRTACSNCKGDARGFSLPSWSIRGFSCKCLKSWVLVGRGRVPYCGIILSVLFSCDGVAFCRG